MPGRSKEQQHQPSPPAGAEMVSMTRSEWLRLTVQAASASATMVTAVSLNEAHGSRFVVFQNEGSKRWVTCNMCYDAESDAQHAAATTGT